jgi:hypothetical protein
MAHHLAAGVSGVPCLGDYTQRVTEGKVPIMITVRRARERDKRKRLVLSVGPYVFHIKREEALSLQKQLKRFKLEETK